MFEQIINVDRMEQAVSLFGSFDENIKQVEKEFSVTVISRGSELKVAGEAENVQKGVRAINGLLTLINRGESLSDQNVRYVLSLVNDGKEDKLEEMTADCVCISAKGKPIKPKTLGQKKYIESIMTLLSKNGIVDGMHGKGGGYKLTRNPKDYKVIEILKLTEGTLAPVACLEEDCEPCPRRKTCRTVKMWEKLYKTITDFFDGVTIADLCEKK